MKPFLIKLSISLVLLASVALAQVQRIVILPFNASTSIEAYGLGLATALQRSLNGVDGLYSPPLGDVLFLTNQLLQRDGFSLDAIVAAFDATTVISGQLSSDGNGITVLLGLAGPDFPSIKDISIPVDSTEPSLLLQRTLDAVVAELKPDLSSAERSRLESLAAQMPSAPSLNAVAEAALRLPGRNFAQLDAAAQLDPTSSWVLSEFAREQFLQGNPDEALRLALLATQYAPQDIEAWVVYAQVLAESGDSAASVDAFSTALAINSAHALALDGRGVLSASATDLEAAIRSYPRLTDAYLNLANLQNQSPQRALQTLRQGTDKNPDSLLLHRAFITTAIAQGDAAGALAYLREVVQPSRTPPAGLFALAAFLPENLSSEALSIIQQGCSSFPQNTQLALVEARLFEEQGNLAAAESILQDALGQTSNLEVANTLAILQARQGRLTEARTTLEAVGAEEDTLQFNLAQIYLEAGETAAALSILEPLATRNPNDAELLALYGIALGRAGQLSAAISQLDQALALEPTLDLAQRAKSLLTDQQQLVGEAQVEISGEAAAAFNRGLSALETGDLSSAVSAFSEARDLQDDPLIAFYQGYAHYLSGNPRAAAPAFQRALQAFPQSDILLNNLGLVQLELGRLDLALDYLQQATTINPQNDQAHLNLGLAYYRLAQFANAVESWERALNLNSTLEGTVADLLSDARARLQ